MAIDFLEYYKNKRNQEVELKPVNDTGEKVVLNTDAFKVVNFKQFKNQEDLVVFVLSDLHLSSKESHIEKAQRYIEYILSLPNGVIVANGDLINNATVGSVSDTLDQNLNILPAIEKIKVLLKKGVEQGRVVANVPGNHENRTSKVGAINPAMMYGVPKELYFPALFLLEFELKSILDANGTVTWRYLGAHGEMAKGGALGTVDSALRLIKEMSAGLADMAALGHTHQNAAGKSVLFVKDPVTNKIIKKLVTGVAAAALITFEPYSTKNGYPAANTDGYAIEVKQVKDKDAVKFVYNFMSLDKAYARQYLPKATNVKKIRDFQREVNGLEREFVKKIQDVSASKSAAVYEHYLSDLFDKAREMSFKYGYTSDFVSKDEINKDKTI